MFQLNSTWGLEPRIVTLEKPIWIAGLSKETRLKRISRDMSRMGARLNSLSHKYPIPEIRVPEALAIVSRGFYMSQDKGTCIIGNVINSFHNIPGV